jgi:hypothetical protein
MLKEEFRTHASYSGKSRFLTFPVFVVVMAFFSGLTLDRMTDQVPLEQMATFTNLSAFLYGLSVGAFGVMGREYLERRHGTSNYLVAMPYLLPISFRTTFMGIYLRDALFYVMLLLAPATLGLVLSAPFVGFHLSSIGLFFIAVLLSFMVGLSLSFFASVVYLRSVPAFLGVTSVIAAVFVSHGFLGIPALDVMIPSVGFQMNVRPFGDDYGAAAVYALTVCAVVVLFTLLAYLLVQVRINISTRMHSDLLPRIFERLSFMKGLNRTLMSKEFLDLSRSGTVAKMFFSFVLPLLFLSFTTWYVNYGLSIPVGFNAVFYAAMVGFVGVMMYSWLNNVDLAEYYSLLPVTVPQLIKTRILVFLVLTMGISTFFVVAISIVNGETELLWLALVVMFVTSLYMVIMTAYLTGLKTNTFLFDTSVLLRFSVLSFFPDVCLTILSFSLKADWVIAVAGIALVLIMLSLATVVFFRGIDMKWDRTPFTA